MLFKSRITEAQKQLDKKIFEFEKKTIKEILGPSKGKFLDIGAFDGITGSLTYHLALDGWSGALCEPTPHTFQILQSNYQNLNCDLYQVAIVPNWFNDDKAEMFDFVDVANQIGSGCSSIDIATTYSNGVKHCKDFSNTELYSITINTMKVEQLLKNLNYKLDFVSIDAEGFCISILNSWPFNLSRPKLFVVELDHFNQMDSTIKFMEQQNYVFKTKKVDLEGNFFFINNL